MALLHLLLLLLLIGPFGRQIEPVLALGDSTAASGGGGGGGGRRERYISLPAYRPPASALTPEIKPPVVPPQIVRIPVQAPVTALPVDTVRVTSPAPPASASQMASAAADTGAGSGAGKKGGEGGGNGGGVGPGNGPGTGPGDGTGGQGGRGVRPKLRQLLLTPENTPKELRGAEVKVTFWIAADGRVQRFVVNPEIRDRGYAQELAERMAKYLFIPARSPAGVPIADTMTVAFTLGVK